MQGVSGMLANQACHDRQASAENSLGGLVSYPRKTMRP